MAVQDQQVATREAPSRPCASRADATHPTARDGSGRGLAGRLVDLGNALLDSYAPRRCLYCDLPSGTSVAICPVCLGELQRNTQACPRCALPDCAGTLCPECQRTGEPRLRVVAPFIYDESIAFLLRAWKYRGQRDLVSLAAQLAREADLQPAADDVWLATPLHWMRQLQRGFNQSDDLLRALRPSRSQVRPGSQSDAAHRPGARLRRVRATPKQALASRRDRQRNLAGAFHLSGSVTDRDVILIDDVYTTGATAAAMAKILTGAGAASVTLWCIARTPKPPH